MAQTKRDRAGRDIPQTVTARTRDLPEAEHPARSTGGSTGAGSPRLRLDHLYFCAVADKFGGAKRGAANLAAPHLLERKAGR